MSAASKNTTIINAPRSIVVLFIQYMAASFTFTALILVIMPFYEQASLKDTLGSFQISIPMLVIPLAILFIVQQFITRLNFNAERRILTKVKLGDVIAEYDLTEAHQIISKRVYTRPGFKYSMYTEDSQGQHQLLFDEDSLFGGTHWVKLSEKLSEVTGIPLKQEQWSEDLNGNLSLITKEKMVRRKRNLIYGLVPIALSFVGALVFRMDPTQRVYLYTGLATVASNIAVSFIYACLNKEQMGDLGENNLLLVVRILTLAIPFAFFYVAFAFLLNGFRLPVGQ
ncbi:MAG: hypothetical protein ABSA06_04225 [Geobacteraceae bacterium]|jgi:hypothetical protein